MHCIAFSFVYSPGCSCNRVRTGGYIPRFLGMCDQQHKRGNADPQTMLALTRRAGVKYSQLLPSQVGFSAFLLEFVVPRDTNHLCNLLPTRVRVHSSPTYIFMFNVHICTRRYSVFEVMQIPFCSYDFCA